MPPPFPKISTGTSEIRCILIGQEFDLVGAASFAIYHIGRLQHNLDRPSIKRLVHAFVSSRLDSCNMLLYGLLDKDIAKIQGVQHSAARLAGFWVQET